MDEIVSEADLHFGQLPILGALSRLGPSSQKDIAGELHVTAPSIANSVRRMEKKGLLTCEVSDEDRRSHILRITEKGNEAKMFCFKHFFQVDKEICHNISEEDLIIFERVLNTMIDNLKEKGEDND